MKKNTTVGSWVALFLAVLSWIGAGYFLMLVFQMQAEHAQYVSAAAAASLQEGQAAQLHVLARDTEEDRATLLEATNIDVLSAVNLIESVSASGTPVHVTSAQPVKSGAKSGAQQVNVVDLSVHTEGPFSSVMRVAQMLEALPLTTSVQELDFSHAQVDRDAKNNSDPWSLSIRLRFYTTAALSS